MANAKNKEVARSSDKKNVVKMPESGGAMSRLEDFERMFDDFFSRHWMRPFSFERPSWSHLPAPFEGRTPSVDVVDRDKEVFVKAELPGVDKDDVEITMTGNSVTIKGETKAEEKEEDGDYHRCEISQGSFSRTVSLPSEVDTDKAKARFKHGVLKLTIPKVKKTTRKNIKVT
ncbi:MAG: Hsp20/alpha crystallin family protein [Gammaproteobacteria bacterium]|nr:Hsp20/alpha crystallin family protein [Gammaproteobacteria bacterium]